MGDVRDVVATLVQDKLPDTGSGFEGEGGDINDAFDFIFTNFQELLGDLRLIMGRSAFMASVVWRLSKVTRLPFRTVLQNLKLPRLYMVFDRVKYGFKLLEHGYSCPAGGGVTCCIEGAWGTMTKHPDRGSAMTSPKLVPQ